MHHWPEVAGHASGGLTISLVPEVRGRRVRERLDHGITIYGYRVFVKALSLTDVVGRGVRRVRLRGLRSFNFGIQVAKYPPENVDRISGWKSRSWPPFPPAGIVKLHGTLAIGPPWGLEQPLAQQCWHGEAAASTLSSVFEQHHKPPFHMIGRTLRQYTITGRLGQGGMGEVWLGRDTTLDREVALKVLPPGDTDATTRRERFLREAKAASALNHPNIITIYEINRDQGIDFIAMEYVQGCTLATLMQHGPLSIETVQRYAGQIAEAVGRAHRAGIVHRDLKPGNIMVTDSGLVKILDFGLAKVNQPAGKASTDAATQAALTRAGTAMGTVGYMSPEQAIGDSVDARSDVFSFGIILYELLAGRLPFAGKTLSEMLRELHFTEPTDLGQIRPDTPSALRTIVARALEKNPPDRYANMGEVAIALSGGPSPSAVTTAFASSATAVATRRTRRPRSQLALALAAVILLLLGGAAGYSQWRLGRTTSAAAPGASEPASAYELTQSAAALLSRPDREGNADRAITMLENVLSQDSNSAIAYAHLASAYLRKQQITPDLQWMRLARENARRAITLNGDLAAGQSAMGFVHLQAGEPTEADAAFRRAAELDPVNPFPQIGLALTLVAQNQEAAADAAFRKAIQVGPLEWRAHGEYAQFHFQRARYAEALAHWEESLKLTPDNVVVLKNLGAAYFVAGRPEQAASILQRALELQPTASIYTNLGTIRFFQGRYTDAVAAFEKAVELGATNHLFWGNLGDGYRWVPGRRADASTAYRRAIDLVDQQIAKAGADANLESRRAVYLVKLGDRDAALKAIETVAGRPTLSAQILFRVAMVFELGGSRDRALASLERALKAGYAVKDLASEPELTALRTDARYQRLLDSLAAGASPGQR